jgi:predicted DNA-binding transcriptional regulator YafY
MYKEDIKETLIKAISQRKPVKFCYNSPDGTATGERIGNSHAMYINYYTGNILVDVYQTAGDSNEKKDIPEWRQFSLSYIDKIEILAEKEFEVQKDYKPNSPKYKNFIAKI